jgi:hypothetical protein
MMFVKGYCLCEGNCHHAGISAARCRGTLAACALATFMLSAVRHTQLVQLACIMYAAASLLLHILPVATCTWHLVLCW